MNSFQTLFMLFCLASVLSNIDAKRLTNTNKKRRRRRRDLAQRKYNDELMKKPTININDRIYYNKQVTTPFLQSICPIVSELVFQDETKLYELNLLNETEFHIMALQNVSHAFLSDVYTSKNYPTHRYDVLLNITIKDIYQYDKTHCRKEYEKFRYLKNAAHQRVHEYRIKKTNIITIDQRPYYHIKDYDFQKPLCPIIQNYKRMNESFSTRENFVNSLVTNITSEYIIQVYTPKNFEKMYNPNAVLQSPSEEDINVYYESHCKHLHDKKIYAYLTTFVLGSAATIVSVL
jgi:hypothetical protein